jgi:hypothetical protein
MQIICKACTGCLRHSTCDSLPAGWQPQSMLQQGSNHQIIDIDRNVFEKADTHSLSA